MSERTKRPDEIFCRSCGEPIKKEAEICPECGVRNKKAETNTKQTSSVSVHDPSQYETTVSDSWWYGILAGVVLWIVLLAVASSVPSGPFEALLGFVALIAWGIMPVSVYFDAKYVRANSQWNPSSAIYIVAMLVWVINIIAGIVYIYRRHETLGEP